MGRENKKSSNEPWIDEVLLKKMQPYDITDSCMFHFGEDFVSFEASKTDKEKAAAYRYFNGKLIQILDTLPLPLLMHDDSFNIIR